MNIPKLGFYYHYKHDETKGVNDHAYEVIGIGKHTENDELFVLYLPLYETDIAPAHYFIRPLTLFNEKTQWNGMEVFRFTKITDSAIVEKLIEIKNIQ